MVATPRKRANEATHTTPRNRTRQSSLNRRRAKSRVNDDGTSSESAEQPSSNEEILAEAGRTGTSKGGGAETEMVSGEFKVGDFVYHPNRPQCRLTVLDEIDLPSDRVKVRKPQGTEGYEHLSELKQWEHKYEPFTWVKVKTSSYPLYLFEVIHFKTEPDDGIRQYKAASHPDFDPCLIAESDISHAINEPSWLYLDEGDRVAKNVFTGTVELAGVIKKIDADLLLATLETDRGDEACIDLRDLVKLDILFKIGDRITQDLNTENAYKHNFVDSSAITHGTILEFRKSSGKFYPWIQWESGPVTQGLACLDCIKLYDGPIELPESEPSEPPMTAEQVIEEMERAMKGGKDQDVSEEPWLPTIDELTAWSVPNNVEATIASILENCAFIRMGGDDEIFPDDEPESYRGWKLCTESPNGGMIAADVLPPDSHWWSLATTEQFGYYGHERAVQWLKKLIDRVIEVVDKTSGQLSLLEPVSNTDNNQLAIIETNPESITSGSTLDLLITETKTLYGKLEEAEQVAVSAAHSALEFAREMGDRLLQLKKLAGHGNWEKVREQIKSPRTSRPIPSSTAALYQRIFERWNELDAEAVATIREASEALKKPRLNSATVADLQPIVHEKGLADSLEGLQADFQERKAAAEARSSEEVEQKYERVEDIALPKFNELVALYEAIGSVTPTKDGKGFSVERPDLGNPFPLAFRTRQQAWDYWQRNKDKLLLLAERKPKPDYESSSISGWQEGDTLQTPEGTQTGKVVEVANNGKKVAVQWENGYTGLYTPEQMKKYGYCKSGAIVNTPGEFPNAVKTTDSVNQTILGLSEVHYAVRKFAALNDRQWDEQMCDEVATAVLDFLAEY